VIRFESLPSASVGFSVNQACANKEEVNDASIATQKRAGTGAKTPASAPSKLSKPLANPASKEALICRHDAFSLCLNLCA
jgi:hypothetical protein